MSKPVTRKRSARPAATSSAVARSLILILSGYLIGTTVAHVCSPTMEIYAMGAGAIGIAAHAVLSCVARQREAQDTRVAIERATVMLERRIDEHVRVASVRLLLKLHATRPWQHEQYMPVVRSPRSFR